MAITRDLWIVLRARDEASRIIRSFGNNVGSAANAAASNMSNFDRSMQRLALTMQQFAMTSMLAGTAMAGMGVAGLHFLKSASDVAVAYEKQVRATKTQVDDVSISLEDLAAVGRRVAREVEIPFEQMQETLFFVFSSMNVTLAESEQLLKGFAKEAVAGQTTIENAARSNIAILNSLGLSTKDLGRIQDVQFQIVRKGVITYEELSNVIGRALPAAARSGQSIETLGAMLAFLTRNGLSAAMAAASAARALESFAHPTTVGRLEQIGIKVRDARGEFLPLIEVMTQMNKKLAEMAQPERAAFFQELFKGAGGTIQARRFWDTAFKNFGDFEEMMGFMTNSTGVFQNSYETMANSVAAKTVLLENKWKLIKETLGRAVMPHLIQFMTILGRVLDAFERLPEPVKNVIAQVLLWGSVISIAVGVLVVLIGVLAFFVSGIMLAGTALVAILAAIAAVTAAILAFGTAFVLAWKNSQQFRDIISQINRVIVDFWRTAMQAAQSVQKSFDSNLRPALERLWEVIENKILPAVRRFIQIWVEVVVPKIKESARIIQDLAGQAFEYIADVINNFVIPAINKMAEWWEKNSDSIRPFLAFAAQLVKWMLIIGAVMLAAPLLAFVTIIAGVILSVFAFVNALKTLWSWIVIAFNAVVSFFVNLRDRVVGFIMEVAQNVADRLRPLTDLFREVFGLILDVIRFFTTLISEIIKDWINPIAQKISDAWHKVYDASLSFWRDVFNVVSGWAQKVRDFVFDVANSVRDKFGGAWRDIVDSVRNAVKPLLDFFKNAGDWLIDAGRNLILGFIRGITEKVKDLREKLKEITDMIPKVKGPKSVDLKLLVPVGKNIMQGFLNGLMSQIPVIKAQLQGVTGQIGQLAAPTFTVPTTAFAGVPVQEKTIIQNITVSTQEINPRIHAEELGFELGNRL